MRSPLPNFLFRGLVDVCAADMMAMTGPSEYMSMSEGWSCSYKQQASDGDVDVTPTPRSDPSPTGTGGRRKERSGKMIGLWLS